MLGTFNDEFSAVVATVTPVVKIKVDDGEDADDLVVSKIIGFKVSGEAGWEVMIVVSFSWSITSLIVVFFSISGEVVNCSVVSAFSSLMDEE